MSATRMTEDGKWDMAEAHLIARHAYRRCIDVEPSSILECLEIWRGWYYHIVPTVHIMQWPEVRYVNGKR